LEAGIGQPATGRNNDDTAGDQCPTNDLARTAGFIPCLC
jgi:hypothetical protein